MSEPVTLTAVGLIAAGSVVFVALPFLRRPKQRRKPQQELASDLALLERRDRALAALKELEFDHRTGKVSDTDYLAQLGSLRRDAAEALRLLNTVEPAPARAKSKAAKSSRRPQPAAAAKEQR